MRSIIYSITFSGYCGKKLFNLINKLKKITLKVYLSSLPQKKTKFTMIKSPHNFNKSREHFETIVVKKLVYFISNYKFNLKFFKYLKSISWSLFGSNVKLVILKKKTFYFNF